MDREFIEHHADILIEKGHTHPVGLVGELSTRIDDEKLPDSPRKLLGVVNARIQAARARDGESADNGGESPAESTESEQQATLG